MTTAKVISTRLDGDIFFVKYSFVDTRTKQDFEGHGQIASLPPHDDNQPLEIDVIYLTDNPQNSGIVSHWFEPAEAASLIETKSPSCN